jgi:hypothetical protein
MTMSALALVPELEALEATPPPRRTVSQPGDMLAFALAGNATFTLEGRTRRFTYRVRLEPDKRQLFFVSVLTGADNENAYAYLGTVANTPSHLFSHGRKSRITRDAPSARAFRWFWYALTSGNAEHLDQMHFWHEGRCGRCGRKLTVPESLERGIGPECAAAMAA